MPVDERTKLFTLALAVGTAIVGGLIYIYVIFVVAFEFGFWQVILAGHFPAVVGLPSAAALSFALVVFLRQTDGPIEFEGLGFKFKGAAGQVVMWIMCFLAIAGAIKLVW